MEREARRDRSVIAMLEIGAAGLLIAAFFLPWYQLGGQDVAGVETGITMDVLLSWFLIPLGAAAVLVATLVGFALPGRGAVVAILVAFGAAGSGVALRLFTLSSGDWSMYLEPPSAARGLWLFAEAAAFTRDKTHFVASFSSAATIQPASSRELWANPRRRGWACSWPGWADS